MRRGLPFWLLRLESARCPKCHRDNVWRRRPFHRPPTPSHCRWCGASMVDWQRITRLVHDLTVVFRSMGEAMRATTAALNSFGGTWDPTVWTVDVETATHDDLREGKTVTQISRVQVIAPDETEAKLVACQMAARDGRMPTRATVVDPRQLAVEAKERRLAEAVARNPLAAALNNPLSHAVRARRLEP